METKQHATKNQWVNDDIKDKTILREVYSDTGLPQGKKKKNLNKQPNLPPKRIRKRTKKFQSWQKEGNHKDQRWNK